MSDAMVLTLRTRIAVAAQRALLRVAYPLNRALRRQERGTASWVVGPHEIAAMVYKIAAAVPSSHSVSMGRHKFYDYPYDSELPISGIGRHIRAPLLLARLMNRAAGFIYVGASGFLLDTADQREFEFGYLRRHGRKIVCIFTGDDIRAPRLMAELVAEHGRENIVGHYGENEALFQSDGYDRLKRRIAAVADRFADAIVNPPVDQRSYLTRHMEPFTYFLPDDYFERAIAKFDSYDPVVIVHAPSSAAIKGTALVRDAIERLRAEGYSIDYRELTQAANRTVRDNLRDAHLVLNQFYGYMPGVFGIEAMAVCCAMLTSADPALEPSLAPGADRAWLMTTHDRVYENTKALLDDPAGARQLALEGYQWTLKNESASASGAKLRRLLDDVLAGRYRS
ncbi:hypothetical protein OSC27_02010 [Microbacterium sp. STN6]|uniref:hypothetical protein n=1 Tax=Microbacterium sp. STN6 TaxID=2995588 RepID=UPI002260D173|nr:hypothetical protein [Microbacterium sp. STN6]MCX7521047.1 hypothetical protein [Microbacterium sp. STN6]